MKHVSKYSQINYKKLKTNIQHDLYMQNKLREKNASTLSWRHNII